MQLFLPKNLCTKRRHQADTTLQGTMSSGFYFEICGCLYFSSLMIGIQWAEWWGTLVILVFGRLKEEDHGFEPAWKILSQKAKQQTNQKKDSFFPS
jgi:hypothetical protein